MWRQKIKEVVDKANDGCTGSLGNMKEGGGEGEEGGEGGKGEDGVREGGQKWGNTVTAKATATEGGTQASFQDKQDKKQKTINRIKKRLKGRRRKSLDK